MLSTVLQQKYTDTLNCPWINMSCTLNYNKKKFKSPCLYTKKAIKKAFTWGTTSCKNVTTLSMYDCSLQKSKPNCQQKKHPHKRRPDNTKKLDQQWNILSLFCLWHLNIYNNEHLVAFTNSKTLKFHSLMIHYALTLQPVLEPQPHQHSGSVCAGSQTPWPTTQYPAGPEYEKIRSWFSHDHYSKHHCRDASLLSTDHSDLYYPKFQHK